MATHMAHIGGRSYVQSKTFKRSQLRSHSKYHLIVQIQAIIIITQTCDPFASTQYVCCVCVCLFVYVMCMLIRVQFAVHFR